MSINFQNKGILEGSAPSTVSCIMNGSCTAGVPLGVYAGTNGALYAIVAAVASNSTSWGIASEAAATGAVTNVIIGGAATLKTATHTAGQIIASIDTAGSATTAALAAGTVVVGLGIMKSSSVAILY